ncbi:MAG: enoyl-CoA hydratase/isomerase family protein [Acidobacteriales bacterium]|nr:enoyl-CoA hydratase/isomerase family protein [Terriglobales bacterium]
MPTTTTTRLSVTTEPPFARITLAHPALNIIDIPMMEELSRTLAELESRSDIATIIFEGRENAFSAGVDIAAHTPDRIHEMLTKFHAVILAIVNSRKVTIASVRGHCLGGGAELAMVCDLVYTTKHAIWGFPEIKLACYPPVATTALAALIGQRHAADLILTGRTINGVEAAALGLVNRALADDELDASVEHTLDLLQSLSPAALAITKKALYGWHAIHFDKGLARSEKIYFEDLAPTADMNEGIEAFLQKRSPKWSGK